PSAPARGVRGGQGALKVPFSVACRSPDAARHAGVDSEWIVAVAGSAWLFPVLFALVVGDAFLVVLPSETAVVALGAIAGATGNPALPLVIATAAVGALVGDLACYAIGRWVGVDRWAWQRRPRVAAAIDRVRATVERRTAVLVFTARYIPFARIAVNLAAGAARIPLARYAPLAAAAGIGWALYNVAVGGLVGAALGDRPLLAIAVSVAVAITLGLAVDASIRLVSARRRE
ncbi:DedA family protein, partial [Agromyces luteolus]|uniref:DedA family protein n=1 Tax=Agromyces luteolus TaxID=88373 RepID=UPI0031DB5455